MRIRVSRLLALGMFLLVTIPAPPAELRELPVLDTSGFLPVVRRQIKEAYAAALAQPRRAAASGNLGMVLDAYQLYDSAALCYERARQLDVHSFRWAYYLGTLELHQGKYDQAAVTLREALRLEPDYLPARLKLAASLLAAGDLDESGRIYDAILKDLFESGDGDNAAAAEALYGMGRVEAARGQTSAALESYQRACELFPSYGAAQYALALAYRKLGEPEKAGPHFREYQANAAVTPPLEDPLLGDVQALDHSAEGYLRRSVELERQGRLSEAIAEQERALEVDPQNVQANINLISLYARHGELDKAEEHFQAAVRLNPHRADAYYDHGVLLIWEKKDPEAERAFRQALEINPFYAEAHNNLGLLLERQGRTEEALAEYETAAKSKPDDRLAHFQAATLLAKEKKYDAAIGHLLETLTPEDDSTPRYLYALAIAYGRKGDLKNALAYIRRARDQAAALRQSQLLASIDKDLHALEQEEAQ